MSAAALAVGTPEFIYWAGSAACPRLTPGAGHCTVLVLGSPPIAVCAIVAITLEAAWEVYENTDQVINRYRAATISLGYFGDSVINSFADMLACLAGVLLAWRLPTMVTVAWVVAVEVILAIWIRDNLTLNIIMLIHPVDAIRAWQMGA